MEKTLKLGQLVTTAGVADLMREDIRFAAFVNRCLDRYRGLDWGELCEEDRKQNDEALAGGERILAAYESKTHADWKIWIITEWDRSATTVLFPSEY